MVLNINDKDYELKYTINILSKMSANGLDPIRNAENVTGTIANTRKAFYYGLVEENSKITEATAGKLMDAYIAEGNAISDVMNMIQDAIFESLGIDTDAETENNVEESGEGK